MNFSSWSNSFRRQTRATRNNQNHGSADKEADQVACRMLMGKRNDDGGWAATRPSRNYGLRRPGARTNGAPVAGSLRQLQARHARLRKSVRFSFRSARVKTRGFAQAAMPRVVTSRKIRPVGGWRRARQFVRDHDHRGANESRSSRISSSSRRALTGSRPADGSSKNKSPDPAPSPARLARLHIPPEISAG